MAVKKISVPFCDVCGEPWLPKHRLANGTINPVFENPDRSKRCGKCKSTRWNSDGVDRRRKVVEAVSSDKEATVNIQTLQDADEQPASPPVVAIQDQENFLEPFYEKAGIPTSARCRHGLYVCPECHPQEAM
jgi:DNA-directed RNA polymerase subunit M/transcription elongation factor TFIIS